MLFVCKIRDVLRSHFSLVAKIGVVGHVTQKLYVKYILGRQTFF